MRMFKFHIILEYCSSQRYDESNSVVVLLSACFADWTRDMDKEKYLALSWPFEKDEKAILYWLSSPIRNQDAGYMVQAFFKTNDGIIRKEIYPWGTLPFLSLGSTYSNGMRISSDQSNSCGYFTAADITSSSLLKSYDAVTRGFYPLSVCEARAGFEKCQVLYHKNGRTFIFPCISIIQSLLCPSVFMANRVLTSAGLDELSDLEYVDQENGFHIDFTENYPVPSLTNILVTHFCWLKSYKPVLEAWKRVFVSLSSSYIETLFPFSGNERITCYGPSLGKTTLVLRFEVDNYFFPFKTIYVRHPFLLNNTNQSDNKRRIVHFNPGDESSIISISPNHASSGKQQRVENPFQEAVRFSELPKIHRNREKEKEAMKATVIHNPSLPVPKFTTQDNGAGLHAQPVEVNTSSKHDAQPLLAPDGLALFYAALEVIRASSPFTEIDVNNYPLSSTKAVSVTSSGQDRTYSVAKVDWISIRHLYVIEISHANTWNLSTLVFSGTGDLTEIREKIIDCLLRNSGHWDKEKLRELGNWNFRTIKHFEDRTAVRFAELILLAVQ